MARVANNTKLCQMISLVKVRRQINNKLITKEIDDIKRKRKREKKEKEKGKRKRRN